MSHALRYFGQFSFPLTRLEQDRLFLSLRHEIKAAPREYHGFFSLADVSARVDVRHARYMAAQKKWKRAVRVSRALSYLPFVRGIFACNSLAYDNTSTNSDIDLIIITASNGVWWARFFCLVFLHILRLRPGQRGYADTICITTFLDENHLAINDWQIDRTDIEFVYWVANMYPIYSMNNTYESFWNMNKHWLSAFLPRARPVLPHPDRAITHGAPIRQWIEAALLPFRRMILRLQYKRFPRAITDMLNKDTRVRVDDFRLKFHVTDKREEHNRVFWGS